MNEQQIKDAAAHLIIAAIWADKPEGTDPRATNAAKVSALAYVRAFVAAHPDLCAAAMERAGDGYGAHPDCGKAGAAAAFGHDLYLTACGHGVGFWDRDELAADDLGDRLTEAVQADAFHIDATFYRGWLYLSTRY